MAKTLLTSAQLAELVLGLQKDWQRLRPGLWIAIPAHWVQATAEWNSSSVLCTAGLGLGHPHQADAGLGVGGPYR